METRIEHLTETTFDGPVAAQSGVIGPDVLVEALDRLANAATTNGGDAAVSRKAA